MTAASQNLKFINISAPIPEMGLCRTDRPASIIYLRRASLSEEVANQFNTNPAVYGSLSLVHLPGHQKTGPWARGQRLAFPAL